MGVVEVEGDIVNILKSLGDLDDFKKIITALKYDEKDIAELKDALVLMEKHKKIIIGIH